jgi:glutamyl-tRNA reductase
VHLRDVDDLQRVVERNRSGREAESQRADALIDRELERFDRWLATLEVVPTITALHERGEAIARQVVAENAGRWEGLTDGDRERLELMATAIVRRLLHQPVRRLKAAGEEQRTYAYVQALRELFGLEHDLVSAFDSAAAEAAASRGGDAAAPVTPIRSVRERRGA